MLYFSFEDERLTGLQVGDLDLVVEEYFRLYPELRTTQRCTFLLDEIQTISGWELFIQRLLDTENIEIFISGSSAKLLSREVPPACEGARLKLSCPF